MRRTACFRGSDKNVRRSGRLNIMWLMLLGAVSLVILLTAMLRQSGPGNDKTVQPLKVYCAAGLRGPMEKIADQYRREYGVEINLQFGGSNSLLNQIEVNKFDTGDLFLAADGIYTEQAVAKGLAAETIPVAAMQVVVVVKKGNPLKITSLDDLVREEITVSVPDPDQAAVGMAAKKLLMELPINGTNRWQQLEQQVTRSGVFKPTVNDVANDVKIGAADAGVIWDFLAASPGFRSDLEIVPLPELQGEGSLVQIAVLKSSLQPTAALRFARYMTASDRGMAEFKEAGLTPAESDQWEERPSITFFCGAVNRRVVDQLIREFSEREGVEVNTIYDGCGTLTGRMKTIEGQRTDLGFPDVYMACDRYYLDNVADWFQEAANVSSAEIVIVVPKGSNKVTALADLVKPGIRVAIGEPDQCTIGALTRRLLVNEGLYDSLKKKQTDPNEVVVEKPSSALLIPDVLSGHADAAVAYITDTLSNREQIDIVHIGSSQNMAIQPLSIARTSAHKVLVRRLYNRITGSPEAFRNAGFEFKFATSVEKAAGR